MTITAKDAEKALNDVAAAERRAKRYTDMKGGDWMSFLWGGIWVAGFVLQHLSCRYGWMLHVGRVTTSASGALWFPLVIFGGVASGLIMSKAAPVRSERDRELSKAIGGMWLSLYAFVGFWVLIISASAEGPLFAGEVGDRVVTTIYATIPLLALLLMGLFGCGKFLVLESVFITVMTAVGLFTMGQWFYLYMAVVGGGTQLAVGAAIYVLLKRSA